MPVVQPSQIFISYARSDSGFVDRLEADLRALGQSTWVDRMRLEGGDDWAQRIGDEITQSGSMIVILSPDAVASKWVRREIALAEEGNVPIFPVLLKPVRQVPLQIAERQYIDFTTAYDTGLLALLRLLTVINQRQERPTPLVLLPSDAQTGLPKDVRLLNILLSGNPRSYDVVQKWRTSPKNFTIPLGYTLGDKILNLDFDADGPHGLLIGQTGSGKSELLRSIIAGLAITYSPQQVNFVLVDYKGGGRSKCFATCPIPSPF